MKAQLFFVFVLWLYEDLNLWILVPARPHGTPRDISVLQRYQVFTLQLRCFTSPPEQIPVAYPPVPEFREARTHQMVWQSPVTAARLGRAGRRLDKAHGDGWFATLNLLGFFLLLTSVVGQEACEDLPVRGLQSGGDLSTGQHRAARRERGCATAETAWQEVFKLLDGSVLKSNTC